MFKSVGRLFGNVTEERLVIHILVTKFQTTASPAPYTNLFFDYKRGDDKFREKCDELTITKGDSVITINKTYMRSSLFYRIKDDKAALKGVPPTF